MSSALLIKPPPAVRAVLLKTAAFVAKNGRSFEHRILNSDKGKTAKFAFLHESSPFHGYYEERVAFYRDGGVDDDDKKVEEDKDKEEGGDDKDGKENEAQKGGDEKSSADAAAEGKAEAAEETLQHKARKARASVADPVARALLSARAGISDQEKARKEALDVLAKAKKEADDNDDDKKPSAEIAKMEKEVPIIRPPPKLTYATLAAPTNLSPGQIEVIKLTAQYAALSSLTDTNKGKKPNFVKTLTEREWSNDAGVLGFLQPRDGAFAYFTALVDVYRTILGTDGGADKKGGDKKGDGKGGESRDELLAELSEALTTTNNNNNTAGNITAAARSKALSLAAYRAEYERHAEEKRTVESSSSPTSVANRIDWHDFVVVETIDFAVDEVVEAGVPRMPQSMTVASEDAKKKPAAEDGGEKDAEGDGEKKKATSAAMEVEENAEVRLARAQEALAAAASGGDDEEDIRIDATYQTRVVSTTASQQTSAATHVVDPISGRSVPVDQLSEHMRIQLLDPNWSKQRKTFLDKQRESNLASGEAIAASLSGFAAERGELFGSSEQELLDREASRQRLADANRLIREQAQQQQAAPAVGASMPPPPNHPRPSGLEAAPAAKRARVDAPSAAVGAGVPPPPPPQAPAPVPPVAAPAPAAPVVPPPPPPPAAAAAPPPALPAPGGPSDTILAPEAFIASLSDPTSVEVTVQTPADSANAGWNLDGRALSVRVDVTTGTVKTIKEACRPDLGGMPTNKMQLRMAGAGFLKDKDGLAALNIGPGTTLDLVPKKRGGR